MPYLGGMDSSNWSSSNLVPYLLSKIINRTVAQALRSHSHHLQYFKEALESSLTTGARSDNGQYVSTQHHTKKPSHIGNSIQNCHTLTVLPPILWSLAPAAPPVTNRRGSLPSWLGWWWGPGWPGEPSPWRLCSRFRAKRLAAGHHFSSWPACGPFHLRDSDGVRRS